jgi:hypothetical protein
MKEPMRQTGKRGAWVPQALGPHGKPTMRKNKKPNSEKMRGGASTLRSEADGVGVFQGKLAISSLVIPLSSYYDIHISL